MGEFRSFIENAVKFKDINEAIKKTLMFVVDDGTWEFEPKTHGLSGIKTVTVAGFFRCTKGTFFLTANTVAEAPIDSYDPKTGEIDSNSKIEIIASLLVVLGKNSWGGNNTRKIGERSSTSNGRLNSPFQLAQWVKNTIDGWNPYGDGDDDAPEYKPDPSDSNLVGV